MSKKLCGTNYPLSICFVVVNEFCERFSYYGMKGNRKTHFCTLKERQKFFSIFYMSINAGSLLSTLITPVLKGGVECFGEDCYALAFGVPAALMIVALGVFIAGSRLYKRNPPQGNILLQVCNCIGFALKNRWNNSKSDPKREHWLDWAEDKYSKRLIQEIKMVLRVLVLYIPLPMFWALFDQQGSRWTIQATRMNLAFGESFIIQPDQMQMLNALMILLFVPIFDLVIYPLVGLCRVNITPLRKMATGMIFAALAFGAATLVEVNVVKTVVEPAPAGECLLQVVNLAGGNVQVIVPDSSLFPDTIPHLQDPPNYEPLPLEASSRKLDLEVSALGASSVCSVTFEEQKAYSLIVYKETARITCKLVEDYIYKNENGTPNVRFLNTRPEAVNITVGKETFFVPPDYSVSANRSVERGAYSAVGCSFQSKTCELNLGLLDFGASYTFILVEESGKIVAKRMEDVKANNVHIAWQIPQYALITTGEVMFSITGLEFSYSQAPTNMKSVLQAGWLLTVAFGNVIVLIVAEGAGLEQWKEFLLFAGLLLGVCIIFSIMAAFYTYVNPEQLDKVFLEDSEKDEDDDNMKKKDLVMKGTGKSTRL
ncbi:solute carrier family 15 member 2 [Nematolebias whitei]|uniref:solute carrier family 15 member 2 n=1 Tax=Nematolebias whitei TaxID=451745 RepID=UPI00189BF695|nr:solute carrier family 15 member 2 [Nematolebias whitei]